LGGGGLGGGGGVFGEHLLSLNYISARRNGKTGKGRDTTLSPSGRERKKEKGEGLPPSTATLVSEKKKGKPTTTSSILSA